MRRSPLALSLLFLLGCEVPACGRSPQPPPATSGSSVKTEETPPRKEPERAASKVVNLTNGWPEQRFVEWGGDKSPAVDKACKGLTAKHDLLATLVGSYAHLFSEINKCFPSAKGAWVLDPGELKQTAPKGDSDAQSPQLELDYWLTYMTPEGKTVRSKVRDTISRQNINEINDVSVEGLFDYDGDGVSEIALTTSHHYGDEDRTETTKMYSLKNGEIVEYKAAPLPFMAMRDVDGDGRPDLLIKSPFVAEIQCSYDGETAAGPTLVAHSLPNGEFSTRDEVAKEIVRLQCGPSPKDILVTSGEGKDLKVDSQATMMRVTCAKIYGATTEEVTGRIRKAYPFPHEANDSEPKDGPGMCFPLKSILKLAGQTPTLTLESPK